MRAYELVLILKDSLSEDKRKKLITSITDLVKGLKVVKEDVWGVKAFSYPIKKERSGFYHLLHLEGDAIVPTDFEKRLINNEQVIRYLLVRKK